MITPVVQGGQVAHAIPVPTDPTNEAVAEQWANPAVRPTDGAAGITLDVVDGPSTIAQNANLSLRISVTNNSDDEVTGLTITPRRGPISGSVADSRVATIADVTEYSTIGRAIPVAGSIAPGKTVTFDVAIPTDPAVAGALPLPEGATYPLLLELHSEHGEALDTERFHISGPATHREGSRAPQITVLYPITAPTDILPGETGEAPEEAPLVLASEQLAEQISPGGRLYNLVDTYRQATAHAGGEELAQATCVALDPAVVDTVERMTHGYTVAQERPPVAQKPQRLRDSWDNDTEQVESTPGIGTEQAQEFLDMLREIATTSCTVALPWANADVNALSRSGSPWLVREAIERGPFTLQTILGAAPVTNVVLPPSGYVTADTAPAMGWADHSQSQIYSGGMQAAWEASQLPPTSADSSIAVDGEQVSTLDLDVPPNPSMAQAPTPATPVRVLVADNTVSRETSSTSFDPQAERFVHLGENLTAVTFQDSLASTLAATGPIPLTTGYSNPTFRYDAAQDSSRSRDITASSAIRLAVHESTTTTEDPMGPPVLLNPPGTWEAGTAEEVLSTVAELMDAYAARPLSFADYLTPPEGTTFAQATEVDTPFTDPTQFSDAEVLSIGQQATYADDLTALLVADPAIALTRYGFTLPLRRDLVTAASLAYRRSPDEHNTAVEATRNRLNATRDSLHELRSAVNLIPPGNVYTRTSDSSPLLIVAENGLPLPVDATVLYEAPAGVSLTTPPQLRIPARGSVTIQMTADLPTTTERTDLKLYLATPQGKPVSQPVQISVQTAAGAVGAVSIAALLALFLTLVVLFRRAKAKRASAATNNEGRATKGRRSPVDRPPD